MSESLFKGLVDLKHLLVLVSAVLLLQACGGGGGGGGAPPAPPPNSPWTWISGGNTVNQAGVYGTQGTAAATNVPGARTGAAVWTDSSNNLWLMGGNGYDSAGTLGYLNDLWKYDSATGLWTWVSGGTVVNLFGVYGTRGTAGGGNAPGARYFSASWTDSSNNFWLMGGNGYDSAGTLGYLNDLWKFDSATGLWTWVSGGTVVNQAGVYGTQGTAAAANVPGARAGTATWIDSSNALWLMGGFGYDDAGGTLLRLNDLWKFDGVNWTWISGHNLGSQAGVYGTKGTAAAANVPGARSAAAAWIDSGNTLWLMGGFGYDSAGTANRLNDLWKFDGANWTWVSGSNVVNQSGSYGTQGMASATNVPGARSGAVSWFGNGNTLWLMGGFGYDSAGTANRLNDLWKFDGANWTWVSGSTIVNQSGSYGTQDVVGPGHVPGARISAAARIDSINTLWLFGGDGHDSAGTVGYLNDLWRYAP